MFSQVDRTPHTKNHDRCLALLLLCLQCPPLQAQTLQAKTQPDALVPLKVAIDPTPYGYQDDKGVTRGTTPEFFVAIANLMGMVSLIEGTENAPVIIDCNISNPLSCSLFIIGTYEHL